VDFRISKKDTAKLAAQFFKRVEKILTNQNVEYDRAVVAEIITKFFPDWRRVLNELQRYASTGKIDSGILGNIKDLEVNSIYKLLKEKDFTSLRKWVAENVDIEQTEIFRRLYESADQYMTVNSVPQLVLILSKYQYQAAFVADPEINIIACFTEVLINCEFK
jgi:DNA polymerase III delta prime subunit